MIWKGREFTLSLDPSIASEIENKEVFSCLCDVQEFVSEKRGKLKKTIHLIRGNRYIAFFFLSRRSRARYDAPLPRGSYRIRTNKLIADIIPI